MADNFTQMAGLFIFFTIAAIIFLIVILVSRKISNAVTPFQSTDIDTATLLDSIKGDTQPGFVDIYPDIDTLPTKDSVYKMELRFTNFDLTSDGTQVFNTLTKIQLKFTDEYRTLESVKVNDTTLTSADTNIDVSSLTLALPTTIVVQMTFAATPHNLSELTNIVFSTE